MMAPQILSSPTGNTLLMPKSCSSISSDCELKRTSTSPTTIPSWPGSSSHYDYDSQSYAPWSSTSASGAANNRVFVHNYKDHSRDPVFVDPQSRTAKEQAGSGGKSSNKTVNKGVPAQRGAARQFPTKLYEMLNQSSSEQEGFEQIVGWQPHGRCFLVRDPKQFVADIMPRFFSQTKLTSFQRQLSLYGFARITKGQDRGAYYHELFLRGRPDLIHRLFRTRVKGTGCKLPASPETEPDFYTMDACPPPTSSDSKESPSEEVVAATTEESEPSPIVSSSCSITVVSQEQSDADQEDTATTETSRKEEKQSGMELRDETDSTCADADANANANKARKAKKTREMKRQEKQEFILPLETVESSMEIVLPPSFEGKRPILRNVSTASLHKNVGPLKVPGRLRSGLQTSKKQPQTQEDSNGQEEAAAVVIKFIPMDLSQRMASQTAQWNRWVTPLRFHDISTELTGHMVGLDYFDDYEWNMDMELTSGTDDWASHLAGSTTNKNRNTDEEPMMSIASMQIMIDEMEATAIAVTKKSSTTVEEDLQQQQNGREGLSPVAAGMLSLISDNGDTSALQAIPVLPLQEGEPTTLEDLICML